jgi:hypothetical protein
MNGPPPPPGIPAPRLGPLALNLRNQMLRKNTNARLAALNSIGVSPPEKNLPRLSNLATFPVTESVLAPPSTLSAKASNWAPARPPPLPPGPPPLPPGPFGTQGGPPPASALRAPPQSLPPVNATYNVPDWQKPPPPMNKLLDHLRNGGRIYREQFSRDDWRRVWEFIEFHRDTDNITGEKLLHPYFYIPKRGAHQTRRKRKQSRQTRRRR